jgi:apolipoprotein D and lipocalin family protein
MRNRFSHLPGRSEATAEGNPVARLGAALSMRVILLAMAAVLAAPPARTAAPQPVQGVAASMYSGRWYQVAHIVKSENHPCLGGAYDFTAAAAGSIAVDLICHERTPEGPVHVTHVKGSIVSGTGNAKFKMRFFGGLISQEYWVLDHAADLSWALMATPGGNYLWLLARRPTLSGPTLAAAKSHIRALGYNPNRLVTPH